MVRKICSTADRIRASRRKLVKRPSAKRATTQTVLQNAITVPEYSDSDGGKENDAKTNNPNTTTRKRGTVNHKRRVTRDKSKSKKTKRKKSPQPRGQRQSKRS